MGDSSRKGLARVLLASPDAGIGRVSLRVWFCLFLIWMTSLTVLARWGLVRYEQGWLAGERVWLLAVYAFYLSLCCTFVPLPTTWIVMLAACDTVGLVDSAWLRVLIVASVGALATCMANLNEYHIASFLLGFGWAGKVRRTRLYIRAAEWFAVAPFAVVALFGFLPIPVDVVRWLAIACRYPRVRYAGAYYVGRWPRYALLAAATTSLRLELWHIVLVQALLVLAALARIGAGVLRRRRRAGPGSRPEPSSGQGSHSGAQV